jgi:hypothetical protein
MLFFQTNIDYTFQNGKTVNVVDIFKKVSFSQNTLQDNRLFDTVLLSEGTTPETLSMQYYNNPNSSWVILLANQIVNPNLDWPVEYSYFLNYMDEYYKGSRYYTYSLPEMQPNDVVAVVTSSGTVLDSDNYSFVGDWDPVSRSFSLYGGAGSINAGDSVIILRKGPAGFITIRNNMQIIKKVQKNYNGLSYFYTSGTNSQIISPYRVVNPSNNTLTNISVNPFATRFDAGTGYTDTRTIRYTLLYKYMNNESIPVNVKTILEKETDLEYKKYKIRIPKNKVLRATLDAYIKASKEKQLGRTVEVEIP